MFQSLIDWQGNNMVGAGFKPAPTPMDELRLNDMEDLRRSRYAFRKPIQELRLNLMEEDNWP
ncbi:hypothetical protein PJF56_13110 [Roseofilum sp. BLCC_M91]|uniref:Uncharacterized protein n=1 Tax=Roseofilum halophilum BLCC-M91 TaxID=3022259 RepID=A0ABT7BKT9_9CYAN|nr:hypothetical protein [Roseofilum halophilum]MDJ1179805.1 hypothetical protein [Roseofilum halophilum BLCC-M91]